MKKTISLLSSAFVLALVSGTLAFAGVHKTTKEVNAASFKTASTNFNLDYNALEQKVNHQIIAYWFENLAGSSNYAPSSANNLSTYTLENPTYSLVTLKSYNSVNDNIGIVFKDSNSASVCASASVESSALGTSSLLKISSGNGAIFTLGARDTATFKINFSSPFASIRLIPAYENSTSMNGAFAICDWQIYDNKETDPGLVETNYTFSDSHNSTSAYEIKTYAAGADYKAIAPKDFAYSNLKTVPGDTFNFYDENHSTVLNPNTDYELQSFGSHNGTSIRNREGQSNVIFNLGYGSGNDDYGSSVIINPKTSLYKLHQVTLQHHSYVSFNDALYYATSNDGTTYSGYSKVTWTGSGNGRTATIDFASPVSYVKLSQYNGPSSETRSLVALSSVSLKYAPDSYVLTFDSQGGTPVEAQLIAKGSSEITVEPTAPTKERVGNTVYTFDGWYTEPNGGGTLFTFGQTLNENLTLYAKWLESTISTYTLTFDTMGGSYIEPQVIPADGTTKFTKPDNPTKSNDGVYAYSFHKWYANSSCTSEFDFNAIPTGDVTAYAGFTKQGYAPTGYSTIDPKYNATVWGTDELRADYAAWELNSRDTFDSKYKSLPEMKLIASPNGESNSGAKLITTSEVRVNNTKITLQITDQTKYFSGFRMEFAVKDYNESNKKLVTLSTGGVTSDSGYSPWNSTSNAGLVLVGDCSTKPQAFTADFGNISSNGMRLRYFYVQFGTYTTEEMAIKYATDFNNANVCGTLPTDGLDETKWGAQADAYDVLPVEVQSYLTNYDGSNAEILECLERYDRVISLHGITYDFMGRVDAGKIVLVNPSVIGYSNTSNTQMMIVVIAIAVTSVTLIGILLVYKRKRNF